MNGGRVNRRTFLIGGGATAGLLLAWGVWPRTYQPNLNAAEGEAVFNAFLKIDANGQIIVIVPQSEMGQGITTLLPQILADELGADWRTIAVQAAPIGPLYANSFLAEEWLSSSWSRFAGNVGEWAIDQFAVRSSLMLTGGGTSVPMFYEPYRNAGAAARILLCKAAATRWGVSWESCDIQDGLVTDGEVRRLKIGEIAKEASALSLPKVLPYRQGREGRLIGQDVPRLDTPSKIDGRHNFAADIRLAEMVYASVRQGPIGNATLAAFDEREPKTVKGFLQFVRQKRWLAAVASNWWAANKALNLADPVFTLFGEPVSSNLIDDRLDQAFESDAGRRLFSRGALLPVFEGATILASEYQAAPRLHLAAEPPCATARFEEGKVEIWVATQAPSLARDAVANALNISVDKVMIYPLHSGASYGRSMDNEVAVQAAVLAKEVGRPVQLLWSRLEDVMHDRAGAPAHARMAAKLGRNGRIEGWLAKVAAPCALTQSWARIGQGERADKAATGSTSKASGLAISGMVPPYTIPNLAVDHHPTDVGLPLGFTRGNADVYSAFFTESFMDELAGLAKIEPMSFRVQALGNTPRLAHCLTTVAAMGGWQGGVAGSGQGIAAHMANGVYAAIFVEISVSGGKLTVGRIIAAVDAGNQINPDIARQQIEGGLIYGLAHAMGGSVPYENGMPTRAIFERMNLPALGDVGEVTVELVRTSGEAKGVTDIGAMLTAPAIANALFTLTGQRFRSLPLWMGD